jgi:hypothetical protein
MQFFVLNAIYADIPENAFSRESGCRAKYMIHLNWKKRRGKPWFTADAVVQKRASRQLPDKGQRRVQGIPRSNHLEIGTHVWRVSIFQRSPVCDVCILGPSRGKIAGKISPRREMISAGNRSRIVTLGNESITARSSNILDGSP